MRSLWKYYKDKPFIEYNSVIFDVSDDPDNASFKYMQKTTDQRENDGTKVVQIMVPSKYLSNFWKTLEMSLISFEINIFLTWSEKYKISSWTYFSVL